MRVVGAIIRDQTGRYLLQLRDDSAPSFRDCWTLFGGLVEAGETPKRALQRELEEEVGLASTSIKSLRRVQRNIQQNGTVQYIYELITDATLKRHSLKEGKSFQFVPAKELFKRRFAFNVEAVLCTYTSTIDRAPKPD